MVNSSLWTICVVISSQERDVGKAHLATKIMGVALARSVARVYRISWIYRSADHKAGLVPLITKWTFHALNSH